MYFLLKIHNLSPYFDFLVGIEIPIMCQILLNKSSMTYPHSPV